MNFKKVGNTCIHSPSTSVFSSEDANNIRSQDFMLCIMFLRRKAMTNLDSILKSRDITLSTKVCIVKATVHRCESWTTKKTECQRIDSF